MRVRFCSDFSVMQIGEDPRFFAAVSQCDDAEPPK
jgi:hypothetical protein